MREMKRNGKLRTILCLIAITALVFVFAGCGNGANAGGSAPAGSEANGSAMPGGSFVPGGSTEGGAAPGAVNISIYVQNPASGDPGFLIYEPDVTVAPGIAGQYGFEYDPSVDPIKDVTALDAAVSATATFLTGSDKAPSDELAVNKGFISKAFGTESVNWMTFVNGEAPNDGVLTDWGYTGLAANQVVLHDGDVVHFYCQKLADYDKGTSDDISWFANAGEGAGTQSIATASAKVGEPLKLALIGYPMLNIFAKEDARGETTLAGAQIALLNPGQPLPGHMADSGAGAAVYAPFIDPPLATSGADGTFELTFDKPGTYPVSACYPITGDKALMAPPLVITVE
ncbi:MAG: DUF4430 domain-containing protein [Clostridiales bacterium]|nr:DUF4430 domain-containing protein [Clostridiales bacterium]